MRLFVGIPVPPSPDLEEACQDLARRLPSARLVPAANRHMTLRFLGDMDVADAAQEALARALQGSAALRGQITGVGAFPDASRARIAWAGVACPGLLDLAERVRRATAGLGRPEPPRPFAPHVTLARLPAPHDLTQWAAAHAGAAFGGFQAFEVVLFGSLPGPRGMRYERVAVMPLQPA
jgi:2'-5' RNA ligase